MVKLKTIEVIQDGIPATLEKLRAHYPGTIVELNAINKNSIVVNTTVGQLALKYLSVYYLVHNQFGEPGLVESTEAIEWVINVAQRKADKVYSRLKVQYDDLLMDFRKQTDLIHKMNVELDASKLFNKCSLCGVHMQKKVGVDMVLDEEARKNSPHYVEDIAKTVAEEPKVLPSNQRAWIDSQYLGELKEEVLPDPEPSVAEQEVMQNEVNEAREIVPVYVRLRIKLVNRRKVQMLELVDTIYYGVLHSGQEIVDDIPFNVDAHQLVKQLNQVCCLPPRIGVFESARIFPNFTSYAQEVHRDGKVVQLIIGVATQSTPQVEADSTVVQDGSLMLVYVKATDDGNGYRSLYLTQAIRDTDNNGDVMYLPTNSHIVKRIGLTDDLDDVILQLNNLYCTKKPDQYSFLLKPAFQGFASRKRKQGYGVVLLMLED